MRSAPLRVGGVALAAAALALLAGCPPADGDPDAGDAGVDAGPDPAIITPNASGWWRDDVFYEVFARSFADGFNPDAGVQGDGVGDLAGLTAKLDYLNDGNTSGGSDLGVDGIWITPIYPSPSYHGYDVTDYQAIKPEYGTLADFDALVTAAHARGIKVVLDLELNHTSTQHPWFQDAISSTGSAHRDYYLWRTSQPTEAFWRSSWYAANGGWYYAHFTGSMPDLNWRNPAVEAAMLDVMRFWLARGVDGFRIDAARYLVESTAPADVTGTFDQPETHEILQRMRHTLHLEYPQALFLGEIWTGLQKVAAYQGEGNELALAFSFDTADAMIRACNDGSPAWLNQILAFTEQAIWDRGFEAPFLTNHDQARAMRALTGAASSPSWLEARLAAATLFAQPGTPFVYYGEELGMAGGQNADDKEKRTPMRWDTSANAGFTTGTPWYTSTTAEAAGIDVASEQADSGSLLKLYRDLIALRHSKPALSMGTATRISTGGNPPGVFALLRTGADGSRVIFVANFATAATGAFTLNVTGTPTVLQAEGLPTPPTSGSGGLAFTGMDTQSFAFIQL